MNAAERLDTFGTSPRALTPLIGRDRDLDKITSIILDPSTSLVTLVGPGGVGKTRLAHHLASRMSQDFADGVHFIGLEHLRAAELVAPTIADAIGLITVADRSTLTELSRYLRDRQMLLILDNMEQVIEASPVLTYLRETSPHLCFLVTSREALRLTAEHLFEVKPLHIPPLVPGEDSKWLPMPIAESPAVQLFLERASAIRSDFAITPQNRPHVLEVCRRTDGLPLAIELAAARLRTFPIETLASFFRTRLTLLAGQSRDMPARLHTMRNAVQWSYDLLEPNDRRLLRRLAVFSGGFTMSAAEEVASDATIEDRPSGPTVVEGIASLVDKSLVIVLDRQIHPDRFGMLETIRDFAYEHLMESGEADAIRLRQAMWSLRQAEAADLQNSVRQGKHAPVTKIEREMDNMRAALACFDETGHAVELTQLCVELGPYWHARGHLTESVSWGRKAITTHDQTTIPVSLRIQLLHLTGRGAWHLGQYEEASALLGTALSLAQENDDGNAASISQMELGLTAEMQGDDVTAARWFTLAVDGNRSRKDRRGLLISLVNLGDAQYRLGNIDDSLRLSQEALLIANAPRELQLGCLVRGNLGQIALLQGDLAETWKWFETVRDLALESRNDLLVADMLSNMAGLALAQHRLTDCGLLLGASRAFCERFGSRMVAHHGLQRRTLESLRELMPAATLDQVLIRGEELTLEEALSLVKRLRVREDGAPTSNALLSTLTEREQAVLALLAEGKSDRGIGEELFISHRTVMRHVASIFKKLAVNNRAAATAIVLASQHNELDP